MHINAGAAALALALVLGRRIGFAKGIQRPHNVPLTLLGAALLWFGWFGFNAGAEWLSEDMGNVGLIGINTLGAAAAGILGWILVERIKDGKPTSVGAVSGLVAGLVAITPACANLTPGWALLLGALAGVACALAVEAFAADGVEIDPAAYATCLEAGVRDDESTEGDDVAFCANDPAAYGL